MKIRSDYVSNSSSSSFIINFKDGGKCIDKRFMSLLKHVKYVCVSGDCDTKEECDKIKADARNVFGEDCISQYDGEDLSVVVEVESETIDPGDLVQVEMFQKLLKLKNASWSCGCGDDWGDDLSRAVQIATLLEAKFKDIEIEGDDHLDYDSIRGTELDD